MIRCYDEKLELEATTLIQKLGLIGDNFCIPLHILKTCTVVEKTYVGFSTLEIRNSLGKIIGIQIFNDKGDIYQITLLEENEKNLTEYRISCNELDSILAIEEIKGQEQLYSSFSYIQNKSLKSILEEENIILNRIDQFIEENVREIFKIYQIKRKRFR